MRLNKIKLTDFRNYESCKVEFPGSKTILVGKNAQGKTNLLESIYYLATLSSMRTSSDIELVRQGSQLAMISAELERHETNITLDVIIQLHKPKILKVNNIKKTSYSQYLGNLIVVNFGIGDLLLLRGTPSDRRRWIDDAISQLYPAYRDRLSKYNKIRIQKNNLLKSFKGAVNISSAQDDLLSVWNDQIIVAGSNIIHLRQKYLKEIQPLANEKHNHISVGEENLLIKYNSVVSGDFDCESDNIITPDKIAEIYREKLEEKRKEEIIRAQSLIGPHRDDISFIINDMNAKLYASQGQQRTTVLALKLAELDFIQNIVDENPVLLLDDVLAELDNTRQNFLFDSIKKDTQTIITTVDISNFGHYFEKQKQLSEEVTIYTVESGRISR